MNKEQFWERSHAERERDEIAWLSTEKGAQQALQNADEIHLITWLEQCGSSRKYRRLFDRSQN